MKLKLLLLLFACTSPFLYSQTHQLIRGKVMSDNFLLQNVDVINKNTQTGTKTDERGEFILSASVNDSILFYVKDYNLKGIKLSLEDLKTNNIIVRIDKKPEELNEVVIHRVDIDWKFDEKLERQKRKEAEVLKKARALKVQGVNNGTIENGMDFVEIGKMLFGGLFKDKKEKAVNPEEFKEVAKTSFNEKFYTETLKLQKEEIEPFLSFCNFDPESKKTISENSNDLILMDFLYKKSLEFKKIHAPE
ncbi:hypothetical protein EOD40_00055 [Flavobacterium sufflavum]|uniref:Carboxypeptidase-like regulatory domain-containing protein n=1 Tax=Flavobacterium sufflavum TaxID=1921138 RepID=A0A3S2WH46_9FLAO|nr:hypothetical protein [Flavobacterium sufflavum]RVT79544.1 hypothetical protein EOD40_00055 [Flavobacterium sufflavum]